MPHVIIHLIQFETDQYEIFKGRHLAKKCDDWIRLLKFSKTCQGYIKLCPIPNAKYAQFSTKIKNVTSYFLSCPSIAGHEIERLFPLPKF